MIEPIVMSTFTVIMWFIVGSGPVWETGTTPQHVWGFVCGMLASFSVTSNLLIWKLRNPPRN